jgi:putative ABC transport system substrate-binding protein
MARARAHAVLVLGFGPYVAAKQRMAELALRHRLPTFFTFRDHVEAGGLMSYSPDLGDLARRGAIYVDKILRGAKPADLPVEQPTKFELVINAKTAKALGLTIPPSLLLQADQIIE